MQVYCMGGVNGKRMVVSECEREVEKKTEVETKRKGFSGKTKLNSQETDSMYVREREEKWKEKKEIQIGR